ncbi:MAG: 3'-5' exonuclease [Pandoraea sp.]|uniref:3'-5' exonuclease n=1 Tax=Pandoraea sp. TaxID=1883445 RepID=UPI0011F9932F|nr:3'-5' exonuclease [Pandoraea sp.]TAM15926.1 MAG: 3'-5' exonuclease [Pandoraea sp.]
MSAIIFDTETTGMNEPVIVEAAWIQIRDPFTLSPEDEFEGRYNPGKPIELGALSTHHILDEELVNCPTASEFALPPGVEYLIGHNVDYDWKVIGEPPVKRICTLALARALLPEIDSHTQSALLYFFERDNARHLTRNAHSAMHDVMNCRLVLDYLLVRMRQVTEYTTWEDVWEWSEQARIPKVMTFGKHKGTPIKDVPWDYKRWLLNQPDVDPYLAKALNGGGA